MTALPNSILYMDAVDEISDLEQQADELIDKKRTKTQALVRLQSINTTLASITTQPETGSSQEKILISLKKQYNTTSTSISNTVSVEDTRNELAIAKDKLAELNRLITKCTAERTAKGWTNPGGWNSKLGSEGTEKTLFCDLPIKGGYDHEMFSHSNDNSPGGVTYPEIPYVNARNVLHWGRLSGILGQHRVNIGLSCKTIFQAEILDYKGNIPGITNIIEPREEIPPDTETPESTEGGYCAYSSDLIYADVATPEDCGAKGGSWVILQE